MNGDISTRQFGFGAALLLIEGRAIACWAGRDTLLLSPDESFAAPTLPSETAANVKAALEAGKTSLNYKCLRVRGEKVVYCT